MGKERAKAVEEAYRKHLDCLNSPDDERTFLVTQEWLQFYGTSGVGWTHEQIALLGFKPPRAGWFKASVGTMITPFLAAEFEAAQNLKTVEKPVPQDRKRIPRKRLLDLQIGFGKHRGTRVRDLPVDYAEWIVQNFKDGVWRDACLALISWRNGRRKSRRKARVSDPHDCSSRFDPSAATNLEPWDGKSAPF